MKRSSILTGVKIVIGEQLKAIEKQARKEAKEELEFDLKVVLLKHLQEEYPEVKDQLEIALIEYIDAQVYAKVKGYKTYLSWDEEQKLKAKLALMSNEDLRKYTLEELASLLRDEEKPLG